MGIFLYFSLMNLKNIKVALSLGCLFWIMFVLFVNGFQIDIGVIGGVFWELLMIPIPLMILGQLILYSVLWIQEKFKKNSDNIYPLIINCISVIFIVLSFVIEV